MTSFTTFWTCCLPSLCCFLWSHIGLLAQELNAKVKVQIDPSSNVLIDPQVIRSMENNFSQLLNQTPWTQEVFEPEERILCNFIITIKQNPSPGRYSATAQIISARSVYDSDYESILVNHVDEDWRFQYAESQPLQYSENFFSNNLVSMLAFYAYFVIGMDYDSFGYLGGTDFFQKMQDITLTAQQSNDDAWSKFGSMQNRFRLSENANDTQTESFRNACYLYHRQGLDQFYQTPDKARETVLTQLITIESVVRKSRSSFPLLVNFLNTKGQELIHIFSQGNRDMRQEAFNILSSIDPSRIDKYRQILSAP